MVVNLPAAPPAKTKREITRFMKIGPFSMLEEVAKKRF